MQHARRLKITRLYGPASIWRADDFDAPLRASKGRIIAYGIVAKTAKILGRAIMHAATITSAALCQYSVIYEYRGAVIY